MVRALHPETAGTFVISLLFVTDYLVELNVFAVLFYWSFGR